MRDLGLPQRLASSPQVWTQEATGGYDGRLRSTFTKGYDDGMGPGGVRMHRAADAHDTRHCYATLVGWRSKPSNKRIALRRMPRLRLRRATQRTAGWTGSAEGQRVEWVILNKYVHLNNPLIIHPDPRPSRGGETQGRNAKNQKSAS